MHGLHTFAAPSLGKGTVSEDGLRKSQSVRSLWFRRPLQLTSRHFAAPIEKSQARRVHVQRPHSWGQTSRWLWFLSPWDQSWLCLCPGDGSDGISEGGNGVVRLALDLAEELCEVFLGGPGIKAPAMRGGGGFQFGASGLQIAESRHGFYTSK